MDLDQLKFFQEILKRSIKSKFYFQLAGWVAKVKGKRRKKKQEQAVEGQDDSRPTNSAGERRKKEGKRSVKGQNDPRPTDNLGARRKKKREQAVEEQDDSRSRCKACLLGFCDNSFLPHVKTSKGRH